MLLDVDGMGAVMEAAGPVAVIVAVAVIAALALGSVIVGCMLGIGVEGIAMLVIAGVVTAELGIGALDVNGAVEIAALGAIVADATGVVVVEFVNGEMSEATGSEQPPSTTEPSTVTKILGDMKLRDSNIALIVFFTGITPRQEFGGAEQGGLEHAGISPGTAISPSLLVIRSRVMSFHGARAEASFAGQFLRSHGLGRVRGCPKVPVANTLGASASARFAPGKGTVPGSRGSRK